ncbi:MAG TPA: class I SAM-dependent methyltransferase [Solirubrobacteraceae bacterium]|nr:class I SAM-dependent methyltransferase [Solirubrobacteraceae bacterium]
MSGPAGACPLCGGPLRPAGLDAWDRLVTGEGPFALLECPRCELGVTVGGDGELERFYGGEYFESFYSAAPRAPASGLERLRERYRRRAAARRFAAPPFAVGGIAPGRVLDIGCGVGELLSRYAELGWRPCGVEPEQRAAELARRRGADVHTGTLDDQPWEPGSFDLVVFSHSLEHIPDPLAALRTARDLLAPGGAIAIHAPNWACWQRRVFRGRWFHLDLPRHRQHFSPRSLAFAATELELELASAGTDATVISLAYSVHYLIAGHWRPGWRLWLAYAIGAALYPAAAPVNRVLGADCCYALLRRTRP